MTRTKEIEINRSKSVLVLLMFLARAAAFTYLSDRASAGKGNRFPVNLELRAGWHEVAEIGIGHDSQVSTKGQRQGNGQDLGYLRQKHIRLH